MITGSTEARAAERKEPSHTALSCSAVDIIRIIRAQFCTFPLVAMPTKSRLYWAVRNTCTPGSCTILGFCEMSVGAIVGWLLGGDWGLGLGLVLLRADEELDGAFVGGVKGSPAPPCPSCAFCQAKKSLSSCISDCVGAAVGLEGPLEPDFEGDEPLLGAESLAGRCAVGDGLEEIDGLVGREGTGEGLGVGTKEGAALVGARVCVGLLVGRLVGSGEGRRVGLSVGILVEGLLVNVGRLDGRAVGSGVAKPVMMLMGGSLDLYTGD